MCYHCCFSMTDCEEDNAIPIEGWINDPTDIDLLHLIPVLQALQYVADVRAFLALRMGESGV
jgi:CTD nuclear envelope phosphatase 1